VVPLDPSLAEITVRIGYPIENIVGVSAYANFPVELKRKPSVGPFSRPNLETIVALRPDLVLANRSGTPEVLVERLKKLGIRVVTVGTENLLGLREAYTLLGAALDRPTEARAALAEFDSEIEKLRARAKARAPRKVLLQVGEDPLVAAAGGTFLGEGLVLIGGTNLYSDTGQTYPRVSVEDILRKDPDTIVLLGMGEDGNAFSRAEKRWRAYPSLAATRFLRVFTLRSDSLLRPGPRFPSGLAELERLVYSEGKP